MDWLILRKEKGKMLQVLQFKNVPKAGRLPSPFATHDRPGAPDRPWNAASLNRTSLGWQEARGGFLQS
jgi:hypothetical protein